MADINELMAAADIEDISRHQVYVVLDKEGTVKGALLAETIKSAHLIPEGSTESSLVLDESAPKFPAAIGIARIWTAPAARRQGLAVRLLEALRRCYARPLIISRKMVAFSQPTTEGLALATRYQAGLFDGGSCLVYRNPI